MLIVRTYKETRSRIRVTSDVIYSGQGPQIVAADIGEPVPQRSRSNSFYHTFSKSILSLNRNHAARSGIPPEYITDRPSITEHKVNLRRLSKMVLAGYGGASLLFFGVSPTYFCGTSIKPFTSSIDAMARAKKSEETKLAHAIEASEAEAAGDAENPEEKEYSWWDVLLGKHDQEILEQSTAHYDNHKGKMKAVGHFLSSSY